MLALAVFVLASTVVRVAFELERTSEATWRLRFRWGRVLKRVSADLELDAAQGARVSIRGDGGVPSPSSAPALRSGEGRE